MTPIKITPSTVMTSITEGSLSTPSPGASANKSSANGSGLASVNNGFASVGNGFASGPTTTLYVVAGPNHESSGMFGSITAN